MKLVFSKKDIIWGGIILAFSDGIASYLTGDFSISKFLGLWVIGSTLYAIEIPTFFYWLEKYTKKHFTGYKRNFVKAIAVVLFFNPLWIFRHFIFIELFNFKLNNIGFDLLKIAAISYIGNIPISIIGNYIIQNQIKLKWRFIGSSIFSAIMILYFAFSFKLLK